MSTYLLSDGKNTLYLMQGGTRNYIEKLDTKITTLETLKLIYRTMDKWLQREDAPGSLISYDAFTEPDPLPVSSQQPQDPIKRPGTSEPVKPAVERKYTPNKSSRNGEKIRRIILHYTTTNNDDSTISWFANPASRVSAHYLVGRTGKIYQFCADSEKAWHAYNNNSDTIGIENSAAPGERLTAAQEKALIQLLKYLKSEYKIANHNILGHGYLPEGGTSCPGAIMGGTAQSLREWVNKNLT